MITRLHQTPQEHQALALTGAFPLAVHIMPPDTDEDAAVPVHPGTAACFDNEEKIPFRAEPRQRPPDRFSPLTPGQKLLTPLQELAVRVGQATLTDI